MWWADTTRLCHDFKAQLIFAGANGRVGNALSDVVGPRGHRQNEDAGGELFSCNAPRDQPHGQKHPVRIGNR
eukprot:1988362-Pyramimonas_sp.AAC.1